VLKIIRHCRDSPGTSVTGQLLGLDQVGGGAGGGGGGGGGGVGGAGGGGGGGPPPPPPDLSPTAARSQKCPENRGSAG
jgi:hypothetical protein